MPRPPGGEPLLPLGSQQPAPAQTLTCARHGGTPRNPRRKPETSRSTSSSSGRCGQPTGRCPRRQMRVLLGDPPIDWSKITKSSELLVSLPSAMRTRHRWWKGRYWTGGAGRCWVMAGLICSARTPRLHRDPASPRSSSEVVEDVAWLHVDHGVEAEARVDRLGPDTG